MRSIPLYKLGALGHVTSLWCLSFLICKVGTISIYFIRLLWKLDLRKHSVFLSFWCDRLKVYWYCYQDNKVSGNDCAVESLRLLETQDQSGKFSLSGGIPVLWETFLEWSSPQGCGRMLKILEQDSSTLPYPDWRPKEGFQPGNSSVCGNEGRVHFCSDILWESSLINRPPQIL